MSGCGIWLENALPMEEGAFSFFGIYALGLICLVGSYEKYRSVPN